MTTAAPAPTSTTDLYLGRQPILDRKQNLVAFELLFRSSTQNAAVVVDDVLATATVINTAFSELGVEAALGKYDGFINFDATLLLSDAVELLPREKVVLEVLETVAVDDLLVERLRELKRLGFRLAIDDVTRVDAGLRRLLEIVDIVKVDLLQLVPTQVLELTKQLRAWPVKLLAEKVDSAEQAQYCSGLGYELFQGYFFARPAIITGKRLSHSELTLMRLFGLVSADADTAELELLFKQDPGLSLNLIRLTNSVAVGAKNRITSLAHAIVVLGRRQLQRWLQLLMFAQKSGGDFPSPLLQLAATRGKMMEMLAAAAGLPGADDADRAFMVGIMSLMDTLLGMPLAEIVEPLNVAPEVKDAVLRRTGTLGRLLSLIERIEANDLDGIDALLAGDLPTLTIETITTAQAEALRWANALGVEKD